MHYFWQILILFAAALGLSLGCNRLMIKFAPRLGLVDHPGGRRIHVGVVPRAGGLAVWVAFMAVTGTLLAVEWFVGESLQIRSWFGVFAVCSGLLVAAGCWDDRSGMPAMVKLGFHILVPALYFVLSPVRTGICGPDGWVGWDFLVFVGWCVVLINAFNLIDGLDGLCGGLAGVSVLALGGLAFAGGRMDTALVLVVMAGALGGFLWYNLSPARIFLGDAGSMLLGFFLATVATDGLGRKTVLGIILLPIAVAGVPLLDVLLALWRRWVRRWIARLRGDSTTKGLFDADREHLHHRLLDRIGSQRKAAVILQVLAVVFAALCLLPLLFGDRMLRVSLVGLFLVALIGVRHLARVEIEQSGRALHLAIKLPVRRRWLAISMYCYDMLALVVAAAAAVVLETNMVRTAADRWDVRGVVVFATSFVVCGALARHGAQVHRRLWARATFRDVASLVLWSMAGGLATFAMVSLADSSLEWSALRATLFAGVFGLAAIAIPRVSLDLLREWSMAIRFSRQGDGDTPFGAVAVFGAGDMGSLLLSHLEITGTDEYEGMRLVGFLDERKDLRGRLLRGFPVLGGLDEVPALVERQELRGIIVAVTAVSAESMAELRRLAAIHGLKLYSWRVGLEEGAGGRGAPGGAPGPTNGSRPEEPDAVLLEEAVR